MTDQTTKNNSWLDRAAEHMTEWVGSTSSIIVHTILFILAFSSPLLFGVSFEHVLLILTTAVSLEAIYLAIFIQITVNRNTESLEEVEEDIDELQEDIDEISEDVDEIIKEEKHGDLADQENHKILSDIQTRLERLLADIEKLKYPQK